MHVFKNEGEIDATESNFCLSQFCSLRRGNCKGYLKNMKLLPDSLTRFDLSQNLDCSGFLLDMSLKKTVRNC
jgi:hypothetical protein